MRLLKTNPKQLFLKLCKAQRIPEPAQEHRFHPTRKWRLDFAWPEYLVGLECDGGVFVSGRHTRGSGWLKDTEKLNTAASMGWRMLRCTPGQLCTIETLELVRESLITLPAIKG